MSNERMIELKTYKTMIDSWSPVFQWYQRDKQVLLCCSEHRRPVSIEKFISYVLMPRGIKITVEEFKMMYQTSINNVIPNTTPAYNSPLKFVQAFIQEMINKKQYCFNASMTEIRYKGGREIPISSDIGDLENSMIVYHATHNSGFTEGQIKAALKEFIKDAKEYAVTDISKSIAYTPGCEKSADIVLHSIYDYFKIKEDYDIFECLLKHWAWQVKRKMLGKNVKWHIWLNFFGASGIGKSYVLNKFTEIFEEFAVQNMTMARLFNSTAEAKLVSDYYILNFDELVVNNSNYAEESISKDNQAFLKSIITSDNIVYRVYGTQNQNRNRNTISCISSANTHLYDIIYDETSMRRFFDFTCEATKEFTADGKTDYSKIEVAYPLFVEFWKSINENSEDGYWDPSNQLGIKIWNIQQSYYPTKTTVLSWLTNSNLVVDKDGDKEKTGSTVYSDYSVWCKENGYKAKNQGNFIAEIKHRFPNDIDKTGIIHFKLKSNDENFT